MALSQDQIDLIRESFDAIRKDQERRSLAFYEAFFRRAPELREMFRGDIEGQGMRFMSTLSTIVAHLDAPDGMQDRLAELGQGHRAMGVKRAHFAPMGAALIETLEGAMGDRFTPEMRAAWEEAFKDISQALIEKGGISD